MISCQGRRILGIVEDDSRWLASLDKLVGSISAINSGGLILVLSRLEGGKVSTGAGLVGFLLSRSRASGDLAIEVLRAVENDLGSIKTKDIETRATEVGATNGDAAEIWVSSIKGNMSQAAMRLYLRVRDLKLDTFSLSALLLALADAGPNTAHGECCWSRCVEVGVCFVKWLEGRVRYRRGDKEEMRWMKR
jgi:hypothetical protein